MWRARERLVTRAGHAYPTQASAADPELSEKTPQSQNEDKGAGKTLPKETDLRKPQTRSAIRTQISS